ncbi:ABC transporter substrate-binding protein [Paracoccus spongiarum]|uniref:ABC transporter substrate-binding protein n=1 Tax=Paracoccus spongiarum TaxID=3064387 RepID=A0ABT9J9R0_9RHOB|nr:ABC transporter substrate-binding protein [Paracoccus sp. 2205BS29-5]MDP5306548.1 ABC transporter substrate-binding protein [Paracoccus sp. 2205BS29-5]
MGRTRARAAVAAAGLWLGAVLGAIAAASGALAQQAAPELTVGTLENGTVNWELRTIADRGLDRENGFRLKVVPLAGNPATQIAMQGGAVDAIVSDFLWVAQQRAAGAGFAFLPYSTAVGGLVVPADSPVRDLAELSGRSIGIAGGPVDKSWLILRAYGRLRTGEDLAATTRQVFGAPPVIRNAAETGEVDAAVNFWHFLAKMKAGGMREVVSVAQASAALGLDPATPLLGYVLRDDWIADHPDLARGLARASRQAKRILSEDPAAWQAIRPIMDAASEAEFQALRDGWIAGIPPEGPVDAAGAQRMFAVMAELGGEDLTGGLQTLPEGLFWSGE